MPRFPLNTLFVISAFGDTGEIAPATTSAAPAAVVACARFPTIRLLLIVTLPAKRSMAPEQARNGPGVDAVERAEASTRLLLTVLSTSRKEPPSPVDTPAPQKVPFPFEFDPSTTFPPMVDPRTVATVPSSTQMPAQTTLTSTEGAIANAPSARLVLTVLPLMSSVRPLK